MSVSDLRSFRDIPDLYREAPLEEVIKTVNDLTSLVSFLSKYLSLQSNFDGQILTVTFTAGETKTILHNLGIPPRYRIILRQEGNGVLDDIPSGWNSYQIQMKNNGAVSVTATIMLVRE